MKYFLPEFLITKNNWLVWRLLGGKKVPYSPKTKHMTDPTSIAQCSDYKSAKFLLDHGAGFDGVGFVLTKDDRLTFIDIDNCICKGKMNEFARKMVETFSDCYVEISQSCCGIHIFCRGTVPRTIKRDKIEMYSDLRYCAVTGNCLIENEPVEAQERLDALYAKYKHEEPVRVISRPENFSFVTSGNVLEAIDHSKQADKFKRLHNGDTSGYNSTSEAAQAYINILNYFSRGEESVVTDIVMSGYFANTKHAKPQYIRRSMEKAAVRDIKSSKKRAKRVRLYDDSPAFPQKSGGRRRHRVDE